MAASAPLPDSSSRHYTYNRKQKSLGLLCTNFLSMYNQDGVHLIGLDEAAARLGVERRRIYDIVNVLESVGVLARKAKNQYSWKGFEAIPGALQELKEEGLRENCNYNAFDGGNDNTKLSDDEDDEETLSNPSTGSQNDKSNPGSTLLKSLKSENRREKSLALLTQNFVKLFVCSKVDLISLDEAARLLLGDAHNTSIMRTKVRRLYDIANVLSSMNLIEKTHTTDTRKPAFRWLGLKGKGENGGIQRSSTESRKRVFGSDVTNINFKRNKVDLCIKGDSNHKPKMQNKPVNDSWLGQPDKSNANQDTKQSSRSYQFGPFAPVCVPKASDTDNNVKRVQDWNSLATAYRPQYQNQALKDLFSHYMDAWASWYSEIAGKRPVHIS